MQPYKTATQHTNEKNKDKPQGSERTSVKEEAAPLHVLPCLKPR